MSSKPPSERTPAFDWRLPTSEADVRALRRLREAVRPFPLTSLNRLSAVSLFPVGPRRRTSAGAEPFRLE
jgi:hypothetical protein